MTRYRLARLIEEAVEQWDTETNSEYGHYPTADYVAQYLLDRVPGFADVREWRSRQAMGACPVA